MAKKWTLKAFREELASLQGCEDCRGFLVFDPKEIAKVLLWRIREDCCGWEDAPGYFGAGAESSSYAVVLLKDGRHATVEESSDATGHGCVCEASSSVYPTLEGALRFGLDRDYRKDARAVLKAAA